LDQSQNRPSGSAKMHGNAEHSKYHHRAPEAGLWPTPSQRTWAQAVLIPFDQERWKYDTCRHLDAQSDEFTHGEPSEGGGGDAHWTETA
jgi:hypothetical protein